jgi:hypothetical protein
MTKHYVNNFTLRNEDSMQLAAGIVNGEVLCSVRANLRPTAVTLMKGKKP